MAVWFDLVRWRERWRTFKTKKMKNCPTCKTKNTLIHNKDIYFCSECGDVFEKRKPYINQNRVVKYVEITNKFEKI